MSKADRVGVRSVLGCLNVGTTTDDDGGVGMENYFPLLLLVNTELLSRAVCFALVRGQLLLIFAI